MPILKKEALPEVQEDTPRVDPTEYVHEMIDSAVEKALSRILPIALDEAVEKALGKKDPKQMSMEEIEAELDELEAEDLEFNEDESPDKMKGNESMKDEEEEVKEESEKGCTMKKAQDSKDGKYEPEEDEEEEEEVVEEED